MPSGGAQAPGQEPVTRVEEGRPGLVSARDFDSFVEDFRGNHELLYGGTADYDQYEPAYRYGYELAGNQRYAGRRWSAIEPEVRQDWEQRYPNQPWATVGAAVRHAWERVSGSMRGQPGGDITGSAENNWTGNQDLRTQRPSYQGPEDRRI